MEMGKNIYPSLSNEILSRKQVFLMEIGEKEKASFFPRWGFQGRSRLNKWIFAEISQKMKISKDIETSKSEN